MCYEHRSSRRGDLTLTEAKVATLVLGMQPLMAPEGVREELGGHEHVVASVEGRPEGGESNEQMDLTRKLECHPPILVGGEALGSGRPRLGPARPIGSGSHTLSLYRACTRYMVSSVWECGVKMLQA
jgi:hypothetical protein